MKSIETAGDEITRDLITLLNTQYVTPFDREDIYELATKLDDVVDYIEEVSDLLELYGIESTTRHAVEQCSILVLAVEQLATALTRLKGLRGIQQPLVELKRLEDEGDRIVHDAIAALFRDDRIDPLIVIRWKDVYEGLERAIDSCETAANVIANIAVKNAVTRMDELTLVAVVVVALFFDFTNGFHDTANSIATSVSTRALSPRAAVLSAAILNFLGAFVSLEVAATIAKGIVNADVITLDVVLAGLVGAITWNLVTWYLGLPSSSSHALIGGVLGSAIAAAGFDVVKWEGLKEKVLIPSLIAPFAGLFIAAALDALDHLDDPPPLARQRQPRLPPAAARLGRLRRVHARHERRAEDDGDHRARARRRRHLAPDFGPAALGDRQRRARDGRRHLRGRLADHQDARDEDREARSAAGLRRADGVRVDPLDDRALRLPGLDDAHDLRLGHGRGRLAAALGGALGRRREHRDRLDHDDPVRSRSSAR